jgi:hypothetical protein
MFSSRLRAFGKLAVNAVLRKPVMRSPLQFTAVRSIVSLEEAKKLPKNYNDMPNDVLLTMAVMGDQDAREERLVREIMSVDNVSWYYKYLFYYDTNFNIMY